jgi:hypothetical protein
MKRALLPIFKTSVSLYNTLDEEKLKYVSFFDGSRIKSGKDKENLDEY